MPPILWDTNRAYTGSFLSILNDKPNWTQVLYGTTTHTFLGDTILENDTFATCFLLNNPDAPVIVPKLSNGKTANVVAYKVYDSGTRSFAGYHSNTNIIKKTIDEIIIESTELAGTGNIGLPIAAKYRITSKSWLEITPANVIPPIVNMNQQGIHQKGRMAGFIYPNISNDVIIDTKKHSLVEENIHPMNGCIGVMQYHRSSGSLLEGDFMWILTFDSGNEMNSLTYANINADPYYEIGCSGCKPSIGAIYEYVGTKAIIGILANIDNWKREEINLLVTAGQVYNSTFIAPYSGIWRIAGVYTDSTWYVTDYFSEIDIQAGTSFTFIAPKNGTLEYLVMYLFNRNINTPSSVTTPMDVYKEINKCPTVMCSFSIGG